MDFSGFYGHILSMFRHGFKCLQTDPLEMAVSPDVIIEGSMYSSISAIAIARVL